MDSFVIFVPDLPGMLHPATFLIILSEPYISFTISSFTCMKTINKIKNWKISLHMLGRLMQKHWNSIMVGWLNIFLG